MNPDATQPDTDGYYDEEVSDDKSELDLSFLDQDNDDEDSKDDKKK